MSKIHLLIATMMFSLNALSSSTYPTHWWKEVPADQLHSWEISPHTADIGKSVVLSKRNELGLLSNFAHTPFTFRGETYPSLEGFWQMMKFPEGPLDPRWNHDDWTYTRAQVSQMIGHEAKKAGTYASNIMKELDINWVTFEGNSMDYRTSEKGVHYQIIRAAMKAKLEQNSEVREVLLKTKGLKLLPDHHTKDTDPPAWKYYQIWMELRETL